VSDTLDEADETVIVEIESVTNGTEEGTQQVTVTLADDDAEPTVSFAAATSTVGEDAGTFDVTVTLSAVSGRDVTVEFNINVLSTADSTDYTVLTASPVTIPAGNTSAAITISLVNDGTTEVAETIVLDLNNPTNASLGTTVQHAATVTDPADS
jgi:hypothetical protein